MLKKVLYLVFPLFLSGCIGSWISGRPGYGWEEYPDIRTVPERAEACKPRGLHEGDEKESRQKRFKELEQAREQIEARDQALREGAFPNSEKEKT